MTLRERLDKLDPRERRLLGVLMAIFGTFLVLLGPFAIWSYVNGKRNDNQDVRDLIDQIYEARAQISERKAKRDALLARYAKPAPALDGWIEETAKDSGVPTTPDFQDIPEVPHGKRYSERAAKARIRKVGMLALAKTLEKIEQSGYPVAVTRLNIKPRLGEPDAYEVEFVVSAYDRKAEAPAPAAAGSAAPASSGATDKEKDL